MHQTNLKVLIASSLLTTLQQIVKFKILETTVVLAFDKFMTHVLLIRQQELYIIEVMYQHNFW